MSRSLAMGMRLPALLAVVGLSLAPAIANSQAVAISPAASAASQIATSLVSLVDYNQQTDPDGLLGLPGQYVARAQFTDNVVGGSVTGTIEVFSSPGDCQNRLATLNPTREMDIVSPSGTILLRLTSPVPPGQFDAYSRALGSVFLY